MVTALFQAIAPWRDRAGAFSALKLLVFVALLLPATRLAQMAAGMDLGPEPLRAAMHESGTHAMRILLLSLCVTPLRQLLRWARLAELRRMVGLFALAYAVLHLVLYFAYQNWRLWFGVSEIVLRFYLTIGFAGVVGLAVLGWTSTDGALRRMGGRRWRRLHKLVFAMAVLGLWHFTLHTKSDITEPALMFGIFLWLMLYRAVARGGAPGAGWLFGVTVAAALGTALAEAGWYAVKTGIDAVQVLVVNLDWEGALDFGPRPAGWVLLGGLVAVVVSAMAHALHGVLKPRRARAAGAG